MALLLILNGQPREFASLAPSSTLTDLIATLELQGDRIAVEHNGDLVQRANWAQAVLAAEDRIEIVHFVGGGSGTRKDSPRPS